MSSWQQEIGKRQPFDPPKPPPAFKLDRNTVKAVPSSAQGSVHELHWALKVNVELKLWIEFDLSFFSHTRHVLRSVIVPLPLSTKRGVAELLGTQAEQTPPTQVNTPCVSSPASQVVPSGLPLHLGSCVAVGIGVAVFVGVAVGTSVAVPVGGGVAVGTTGVPCAPCDTTSPRCPGGNVFA